MDPFLQVFTEVQKEGSKVTKHLIDNLINSLNSVEVTLTAKRHFTTVNTVLKNINPYSLDTDRCSNVQSLFQKTHKKKSITILESKNNRLDYDTLLKGYITFH